MMVCRTENTCYIVSYSSLQKQQKEEYLHELTNKAMK